MSKRSLERLWIFTSSTCVGLWYGHLDDSLEGFPGSVKSETLRPNGLVTSLTVNAPADLPTGTGLHWQTSIHQEASLSFCVTPSSNVTRRGRNINVLSISYAFRPHLRTRLTLSGLTFLRKPYTFGDTSSHRVYRYLCRQGLLCGIQ